MNTVCLFAAGVAAVRRSAAYMLKLSVCVMLFFCLPAAAESDARDVFTSPLDAQSARAFAAACAAVSRAPVVKGTFVQTKSIVRINRNIVSSGNFIIDADNGIVWDIKKPYPSVMTVTANRIIQTSADGKKSVIDAAGNGTFERFSGIIRAVFRGNAEELTENFNVYFTERQSGWIIGLIPRESAVRTFTEQILMTGDDTVKMLVLYERSGDFIQYELSGHVFTETLTDEEKVFFDAG